MNRYVLLSVLAVASVLILTNFVAPNQQGTLITKDQTHLYNAFIQWQATHGKIYRESEQRAYRFLKFKSNYYFVIQHNARYESGLETFTVSMNQYADMDNYEFSSIYLKRRDVKETSQCKTTLDIKTDIPAAVDWADKAVAPVRNQGQCGSCWAFSAAGSLEGLNAIKNGKIDVYSTQQLVDCAGGKYGNQGCNGGDMDSALWYVIDNGIALESKYPYTAKDGKCHYNQSLRAFSISDCAQIAANKSAALKSAVATQPVAISVQADTLQFQLYKSGVFSGKCGTDLDHGITLTGYGTLNGADFWKCKNSWGAGWGVSGYIMIARSDKDGPGQCGILMENTVPIA